MAVWSCAPFFNEFALLDLKIAEELDVVDKLVIAEADRTHQGAPKPLHLKGNERYRHPKIDVVLLEDRFDPREPWANEALQRDSMQREFSDDDVVIVSDLDEIHNRDDIAGIVEETRAHGHVRLQQQLFYYKINLRVHEAETGEAVEWTRAFAVTGRHLRESGRSFTHLRKGGGKVLPTKGKHFSYLSDPGGISEKIRNFAHAEFNRPRFTDPARIEQRIRAGIDPFERGYELERVEVDASYPAAIRDDLGAWRQYIAA